MQHCSTLLPELEILVLPLGTDSFLEPLDFVEIIQVEVTKIVQPTLVVTPYFLNMIPG